MGTVGLGEAAGISMDKLVILNRTGKTLFGRPVIFYLL